MAARAAWSPSKTAGAAAAASIGAAAAMATTTDAAAAIPTRCRAVCLTKYGGPENMRYAEVEVPRPGPGQVLVQMRASSMTPDVWHVMSGKPYFMRPAFAGLKPKNRVLGTDLSGVVVAVGPSSKAAGGAGADGEADEAGAFKPGDEVMGETTAPEMMWTFGGAYAQYVAVSADAIVRKPRSLGWAEAATLPTTGFITLRNLQAGGLRDDRDAAGAERPRQQRVLVNGAAGNVGTLALQIAHAYGAHVTAVDGPGREALLRRLGADEVIDYTAEGAQVLPARDAPEDEKYDLVFDVASTLQWSSVRGALRRGNDSASSGTYIVIGHDQFGAKGSKMFGAGLPAILGLEVKKLWSKDARRMLPGFTKMADSVVRLRVLQEIADLAEAGALTPVVDRAFPLEDAAEAMRYMLSGEARGRIVVTSGDGEAADEGAAGGARDTKEAEE